jgi:hypothetical protein
MLVTHHNLELLLAYLVCSGPIPVILPIINLRVLLLLQNVRILDDSLDLLNHSLAKINYRRI